MAVPNPFEPNEEAEQFVIEQFNELIPRFREEQGNYVDYARAAQELADVKTRKKVIAELCPYAEDPAWSVVSQNVFGMLLQLGAKDLDVTAVVDEVEKYKDYPAEETRLLFNGDGAFLQESVHPRNFDQLNRFLKLQSSITPDPLMDVQNSVIWFAAQKSKKFREDPRFAWLVNSRFVGANSAVDEALKRIAKAQKIMEEN